MMSHSKNENYSVIRGSLAKVPKLMEINPNIKIELLNKSHAKELFDLTDCNRLYLRKWLPWVDSCTRNLDTLKFIQSSNTAFCENMGLTFGIFYGSKMAGTISFNTVDWTNKSAEIGYWIGEEFQGFGIVTLTCSRLIDIAFTTLDLEEVCISCASNNTKSQNIPIRLGFKENKFIPKKGYLNGVYVDHYVYLLKKYQWIDMKKNNS